MQALYLLAVDPVAEVLADRRSFGFRRERSCADAMVLCFTTLSRRNSAQWVLEGDIKSCFDRIDHDYLLNHAPMDGAILRKWLKSGYMEQNAFYDTEEGTPQGGIISPVLANLALDGLERKLRERYPRTTGQGLRAKVNLVRYADDFIITGSSKELLETEVRPLVEQFMAVRGLELSPEKTLITHIVKGFDFLGWNFRKYSGKMLVKPSRKNMQEFLDDVRKVVKANNGMAAGNLVALLNPKIRGWAEYHRSVNAKDAFNYVDHAIFEVLWRWCRRRHPNKSRHWVKCKYFTPEGGDNWVFTGQRPDTHGRVQTVTLRNASSTGIRRHVIIRLDANPYDPAQRAYFAARNAPGGKVRSAVGSTARILGRIDPSLPQASLAPRLPTRRVLAAPLQGR